MTGTGVVFDVQRFSIHDGPGIRTVVFFKGCSLRCPWCQNPESLRPCPELSVYADRCIDSGACARACPRGAIVALAKGRVDRALCDDCGVCATECPSGALRMIGRRVGVDELVRECSADRAFFAKSGGGVTLSGGEPVLQSSFAAALLERLHAGGVHTWLETAGAYPWRLLAPLVPHLDGIFFDWKLPRPDDYALCRGDGRRVLDNLARLLRKGAPVTVRVPLLPGLNTTSAQTAEMAATLARIGVSELQLLRSHRLWQAKLSRLRPTDNDAGSVPVGGVDEAGVVRAFAAGGLRAFAP